MNRVVRCGPDSRSTVADEHLLAAVLPHAGAPVVRVERELSRYSTSATVEDVRVYGERGQLASLVLKDCAPEALLDGARDGKPDFLQDPGRELAAYAGLLRRTEGTRTPSCWASVDQGRRQWLLLEKVPGVELYQIGDIGIWAHAAAVVATVHRDLTAALSPADLTQVLRQDEGYLRAWSDRARRYASQRGASSAAAVDGLASAHRRAVAVLADLPPVVLHGDLYASNVLVVPDEERVCLVDWEMVSVGPAVLDLAALVSGSWTGDEREQMAEAYFRSCDDARWRPGWAEFDRALRCARLHLCVQWLGWSAGWVPPEEHAHDWLGEALRLAEVLDRTEGRRCGR